MMPDDKTPSQPETITIPLEQLLAQDQPGTAPTESGDTGAGAFASDFGSHFGPQVNPVPMGQILPFPEAAGGAGWLAPVKAAKNILQAHQQVMDKAIAAYKQGDLTGAAAHALYWMLPVIGPTLDQAGDEAKAGRWGASMGDTFGLAISLFGPQAAGSAWNAVKDTALGERVAAAAERAAQSRAVKVMAPTIGANKVRFGNIAEDVGADVLRQTTSQTPDMLRLEVNGKLGDAYDAADKVADARLNARTFPTQPIIDDLLAKRANLTAQTVEGSQYPRTTATLMQGQTPIATEPVVKPIGTDVVPAPNAARVAQIDQAIKEIQQLGPDARYEALRRIRQAYDGPARMIYNKAVTPDFLKLTGEASGAADVTGSLREALAKMDPATAQANTAIAFWKPAADVMNAAHEVEQVRPTVGRQIMARGLGAAVGAGAGAAGGEPALGATAGAIIAPTIEQGLANLTPTMRIVVGRQMVALADALRTGNAGQAMSAARTLRSISQTVARASAKSLMLKAGQLGGQSSPQQGQLGGPLVAAPAGTPGIPTP